MLGLVAQVAPQVGLERPPRGLAAGAAAGGLVTAIARLAADGWPSAASSASSAAGSVAGVRRAEPVLVFSPRSVASSTACAREPRRIGSGSGVTRRGESRPSTSQRTPQAANVSSWRAPSVRRAASCSRTGALTGAGSGGGSGSERAAAWARRSSRGVGASRGDHVTSASSRRPRSAHSWSVNSARTSSMNGEATSGSPSSSEERHDRNSTSCGRETQA